MALQDPTTLYKDSTVYNYRLMMRIHHSTYKTLSYFVVLAVILTIANLNNTILGIVVSYPLVLIMHSILVHFYLHFTRNKPIKGWSFRLEVFWTGVLPEGHAPLQLIRKLHHHILWIGLALIEGLYPWVTSAFVVDLALVHLWVLAPRLWMIFRFRPYRSTGILKINAGETSCYTP